MQVAAAAWHLQEQSTCRRAVCKVADSLAAFQLRMSTLRPVSDAGVSVTAPSRSNDRNSERGIRVLHKFAAPTLKLIHKHSENAEIGTLEAVQPLDLNQLFFGAFREAPNTEPLTGSRL